MKKLVFLSLSLCLLLCSAATAQDYTVYNELGSDGVFMSRNDDSGFGGLYDVVSGLIHYNKFSVQAQYKLKLGDGFDSYDFYGEMQKANVWFRPISALEIAVGNHFYQALPSSYFMVYNEYSPNGWYGKEKLGATLSINPVTVGLNIPQMHLGDNFSMKLNVGLNIAIANDFNIGAAYKMETESLGIFLNFGNQEDLYIGGGYTFNGIPLLWERTENNHLVDFTILYNMGRTYFGGDLELSFSDEKDTPFYIGGLFGIALNSNIEVKVDAKWNVLFREDDNLNNPWKLTIHPRLVFSSGNHELIGGIKFENVLGPAAKDDGKVDSNFYIPVSWKYTF